MPLYYFSVVIAYGARKYGDNPPKTMADFFDADTFPGKRALYKWGTGMWEAALLADGVAAEDLYPLDLDRAHRKIAALKDHVAGYWGNGSESQMLLLDGDASMALIWNTRAMLLDEDTNGDITFTWNQGLLSPGSLSVMKGGPGGKEAAMRYLASTLEADRQKLIFDLMGQGPVNPAADALIAEDRRRFNPVDPENSRFQSVIDMEWYAEHYGDALDQYTDIISS